MSSDSSMLPTVRETDVLRLVADGLSNAEIAARLWITERTVKHHLASLCRKLHARNRAHLIARAYRAGHLDQDCPSGPCPGQPPAPSVGPSRAT